MKSYNIAVIGATGLVGRKVLELLDDPQIPISDLYLFSSEKSAGLKITFQNKTYVVEKLTHHSINKPIDYALFTAGGSVSLEYVPLFKSKNITVIDNSSVWRMDPLVPLVVFEVNVDSISKEDYVIANPNCSTIQSVLPLKAIDDIYQIKRVVYSTYQAVSGSGVKGTKDLEEGILGKSHAFYMKQIAYNVLPVIDVLLENGYTKEEIKMIEETKKILNKKDLNVTATCVRVPVINGHSVSVNIECEKPFELKDIIALLKAFPGIKVFEKQDIPTPLDVSGQDLVYVGRIRRDESISNGLNLWVVGDNLRKGAATNAVQILKKLLEVRHETI